MLELITLPYARPRWSGLLRQLFEDYQENAVPLEIQVPAGGLADSIHQLGVVTIRGNQEGETHALAVIEISARDTVELLRNRVGIRNFAARLLAPGTADGLLIATIQPGNDSWRFTFVHRETRFTEDGDLERIETPTRRFTYVLGPDESCRTPDSRFQLLARHRGSTALAHVLDAFSVEKLSDEFFTTYKRHYADFCHHLIENSDLAQVLGIELAGLEGKERDRALKPLRDFVKKLLGRLVFLHFIQKKGWLGCPPLSDTDAALPQESMPWVHGSADFLREMFQSAPPAEQENFHSSRLVPLFFQTLNAPDRAGLVFPITGNRVPYLNGGLFEPDFPGVEAVDFPAPLFAALLEFFRQYHFTIDENDPEDHEIGIDPEMLGRIFENLLEDNKDKGAYYTPKPVVQYMCQQSLIHALAGRYENGEYTRPRVSFSAPSRETSGHTDAAGTSQSDVAHGTRKSPARAPETAREGACAPQDARAEIERLVRLKEPIDPRKDSWLARHATDLSAHLDDLRICDPAIGSGAFPIGLLQEIYWTKLTLNPSLDRAHAKRGIIQHCIHGVDLDAGAVEIARLRFWLALIVDENVPTPLPNLDYQIMQGNSLLESFEGERLDQLAEPEFFTGHQRLGSSEMELDFGINAAPGEFVIAIQSPERYQVAELREEYYACHDPTEKADLRARIDTAVLQAIDARFTRRRDELVTSLRVIDSLAERAHRKGGDKKRATMQAELDALAGKSARLHTLLENPRSERPFFLWHLWFRQILADAPEGRGGFDIVIANPPYVRHESIKDQKPALKAEPYECFDGVADLLVYFYECAVKKLRPGGVLTFITSNKFYRAGYGKNLRAFLTRELTLHRLIDFGDAPVFDAIAYASILEGSRTPPAANTSPRVYTWEKEMSFDRIHETVTQRGQPILQNELISESWRLESPAVLRLLSKLRAMGTPLGDYVKGRWYWGLKTGLNEAFIVDHATRNQLISEHASSADILKPLLRGRDVKRWAVEFADKYLIKIESSANAIHSWSGKSRAEAEPIFAEKYPAVHRWLNQFREGLIKRDDQGTHFWELRSCAYWAEFTAPKLVVPAISGTVNVAIDREGFLSNNKSSIFVCDDAAYVSAIVNSSVAYWFTTQVFATKQGGFYDFEPRYSSQWPIPAATPTEQATLSALVDTILAAKRAGDEATVKELEGRIDRHVFRLYGLTPEEIALVEGASR